MLRALETGTECEVLEIKAPVLRRIEQLTIEFDQDKLQPEIEITMKLNMDRNLTNVTSSV